MIELNSFYPRINIVLKTLLTGKSIVHSENADYKQEMEMNAGQAPVVCQYSLIKLKLVHSTMLR